MKQCVTEHVVIPEVWVWDHDGVRLQGLGNHALLARPMTAFFASRACPAPAIRAGLAWTLEQVQKGAVVIGGFHSPLERSVLKMLLEAGSPAVAVLARDVESARLPAVWQAAIKRGHLVVISQAVDRQQLDRDRATARNELVVGLANRAVVAYVSLGGSLAAQTEKWRRHGKLIQMLHGKSDGVLPLPEQA